MLSCFEGLTIFHSDSDKASFELGDNLSPQLCAMNSSEKGEKET